MATKLHLKVWVTEALRANGGSASLTDVAKHIWQRHETELRNSGDLLYTWQYDMRWAATNLRQEKIIRAASLSPRGIWELV